MKQEVAIVGLDLAKNVFQVHAIGRDGAVLLRRKLRRAEVIGFFSDLPSCLVGMEACAWAHHWARELIALGHEVRLMPPAYVKHGKTDAADAEATCEAVTRPTIRFVAVKFVEQQAVLMLHKSCNLMVAAADHVCQRLARAPGGVRLRDWDRRRRRNCDAQGAARATGRVAHPCAISIARHCSSTEIARQRD